MQNIIQQTNNDKEDRISRVIYRILEQVFGEEATRLIYQYLESKYSVKKNEVSAKIEVFAEGLEEFLRSGAYVIEKKILDDMYSSYGSLRRLELERIQEEHDFVGQMRLLMQKT